MGSHPSFSSPWPHRIAVTLVCSTFPLLFIGGLVTSKGVGLAVPDWPTTFGYNMFLYPWSKMVGGIFYEHSHRLVASFVGLLTIALALTFWLREKRNWLRWLGVAALVLVIVQGVLGGLRVVLLEQTLAVVHAATAQIFFALTICLAIFTSVDWKRGPDRPIDDSGPTATAVRHLDRAHLCADSFRRGVAAYRRTAGRASGFCDSGGNTCVPHCHAREQAPWGCRAVKQTGAAPVRSFAGTSRFGRCILCC